MIAINEKMKMIKIIGNESENDFFPLPTVFEDYRI
jgi:hypothetical protein